MVSKKDVGFSSKWSNTPKGKKVSKIIVQYTPANFGGGAAALLFGFELTNPDDLQAHYALLASRSYPDMLTAVGSNTSAAQAIWDDYQAAVQKIQGVATSLGVTLPSVTSPEGPPASNG